jgi:ectoine hydroxylase-related dioxygenase (phytanoyl-CoA dioxygenase family)
MSVALDERDLRTPYPVTDKQVEHFHDRGWVRLPRLLGPDTVARILRELDTGAELVKPTSTEKWMTASDYSKVLRSHDGMAWKQPFFHDLGTSPRLTSAALRLMRVEVGQFIHDMSFIKPGTEGLPTPFHQDFPHWPFDRTGAITIWVALTDLAAETGTLQFLGGSHREPPLGRFSRSVGDDMRNAYPHLADRYPVEAGEALAAGDATVHMDLTIHGSGPNTTDLTRAAYTARYMPTDVLYTGSPHRHFDSFGLTPGAPFTDSELVPRIEMPPR